MILRRFLFAGLLSLVSIFSMPVVPIHGLHPLLNANGQIVAWQFNYDFTKPNNVPCTATLTSNCVTGFTVTTLSGTTVVGTPLAVPLPAPVTGVMTGISSGPYTQPATVGPYTAVFTTNFLDITGVARVSTGSWFIGFTVVPPTSISPDPPQNPNF